MDLVTSLRLMFDWSLHDCLLADWITWSQAVLSYVWNPSCLCYRWSALVFKWSFFCCPSLVGFPCLFEADGYCQAFSLWIISIPLCWLAGFEISLESFPSAGLWVCYLFMIFLAWMQFLCTPGCVFQQRFCWRYAYTLDIESDLSVIDFCHKH